MVDRDRAFLHSKLLPPHVSCSLTRFYPAGIQTVDWLVQETLKTSQGHPQSTHPVPGGRPRLRGNDTWRPHEAPRRKAPPRTSLAVATARFLRSTPTDSAVATFGDGGNARDRRRNDAVRGWRRFRTILSTWIPTTSHRESHAIPPPRERQSKRSKASRILAHDRATYEAYVPGKAAVVPASRRQKEGSFLIKHSVRLTSTLSSRNSDGLGESPCLLHACLSRSSDILGVLAKLT